ncbi:ABC transporter permease [Plebeiibacterium sediminum]|uniref:ABC transporter permease n=1 Tax=Plebeiibacterium sediminum TaxID=2992112 RepID=A0AAE3M4F0_9BACT|nr:ABC transporter permease [Plebeiobacterium sediminum]MCW3786620.1 ABC transporter permease [Plebeiobacterium sediminum]
MIHFKEIIRSAIRNKTISIISISGMSIAISIVLLIGFWSINEFSYDSFHKDADQIYRLCLDGIINDKPTKIGGTFKQAGPLLQSKIPEIEALSQVHTLEKGFVTTQSSSGNEEGIITTDISFFNFFTYLILLGNSSECLNSSDKIVIDEEMALKYFPNKDAIGNIINVFNKDYQVSAIMKNMPENSHLQAHFIISFEGIKGSEGENSGSSDGYMNYLKISENSDLKELTQKVNFAMNEEYPFYKEMGITEFLQPLKDIHFSSDIRFDFVSKGDKRITIIFLSLAALILIIASFNFINLSISTSFLKAKSIGIKKINGCSKTTLFLNAYLETGLHIFLAFVIGIIISAAFLPYFGYLSGTSFDIDFSNYKIYLYSAILFIALTLITGTIPFVYILRFNPESIIRNKLKSKGISPVQHALVIVQFAASIILLIASGIIQKQIYYLQHKDLGFDKEHIVYFESNSMAANYKAATQQLKEEADIIDVTSVINLPCQWNSGDMISIPDDSTQNAVLMEIVDIQPNYFQMLKIPVILGENPFLTNNDASLCLLNETAVKRLNLKDPIGKQVCQYDLHFTIAGVVKDVNTKSLHNLVDPQIFLLNRYAESNTCFLVKISNNNKEAIQSIEKVWNQYNPDEVFTYHFLDSKYDELYQTENTASKIIAIGMVIAIFLAFMGLYSITYYSTERRIKEIGIRKVNGAKTSEVMLLLNTSFVKWIIIAFIISAPIAYYAMHKWLENFAYKTSLSWWIFAGAGAFAFVVAMTTVSFHTYKAATSNPVKALRYE